MRGLVAAVAVIVVVGAVMLFTGGSAAPSAVTPAHNPTGPVSATATSGGTNVETLLPVKRVLECETPTTIEKMTKDGKTEVLHVKTISDGAEVTYLEVDSGFIDRCQLNSEKAVPGKLPGRASYEFEVPRKDTYYVYLRAKWRDDCGNSVWVRIDDETNTNKWCNLEDEEGFQSEKNFKWAWHALFESGAPKGYELAAGKHTLWFNVREDGPKLDQWLISTEAQKPVGADPVKKQ